MKNVKFYNIYIFISTLTRNIIDIYSVVQLYKNGININNIIGIYSIVYFLGAYISVISLKVGNIIGYKYILILSSIVTSISFFAINQSTNLYIIAIFLSMSIFTYHPIKHYYGILLLKEKHQIGNMIILTYISSMIASYFTIKEMKMIYLIIVSLLSIFPTLFIVRENKQVIKYPKRISKSTFSFFILDQAKIIFLLLEPLYLYLISKKISFVGVFNIIITITSIVFVYVYANRKGIEYKYKFINTMFTIILFLKLSFSNKYILLLISIFEGIGIKTNELISTLNLYKNKSNVVGYIIICELIFCLTRSFILSIAYFLKLELKIILYILLIGIFFLGYVYKKEDT